MHLGDIESAAKQCHIDNGGEWFYKANKHRRQHIINEFLKLPVVLEINHYGKKYGFVHGHIEQNDWDNFKQSFNGKHVAFRDPSQLAMWGRDRIDPENKQYTNVAGVDAVIMGHTVTQKPCKRDNCYYIDTGAVHWGTLAILDLSKF